MKLVLRTETNCRGEPWAHHFIEFEFLGRKFEVWNNNCYFAFRNVTTGREYFSATWFRIKQLEKLYGEAVVMLAEVEP